MEINKDYTVIGIDGGGTKTRGVLVREGQIMGTEIMGTTRIGSVGMSEACERVLNLIMLLCAKSGIPVTEVDAVVMGLAGIWLEEEKMRAMNLLRTLARTNYNIKLENLIVCSDVELAHQGAFSGDTGIVTIVGTGSIALGNPAKKKLIRCGGWGIELDDEGSGAWIGREGLTAVVRELDGRGKKTNLTQIVKSEISGFDIEQPRTIVKEYNEGKFAYQNLTPLVMQCAEEGDEVCLNIINRSAHHLLELPMALVKQFKAQKVNVVLMGGIIENDTLLSKLLIDLVNKEERLNLLEPKGTAITGAIALGMQLLKDIEEE